MAKRFWEKLTPAERKAIDQGANLIGEVRDLITPGWRDRRAVAEHLLAGLRLRELREERQISQEDLADRLERTQSAISQIEKRGDLLLSTFVQYIEATGGELVHFTVRYPEGDVQVEPMTTGEEAQA